METFETICALFIFGCIVIIALLTICFLLWHIIIGNYLDYTIGKKENKIQWRCVEDYESMSMFRNKQNDYHICDLSYRVLPSELKKFVKVYGSNEWKDAFLSMKIKSQSEFTEFVKDFKTVGDIERYISKEQGVLWYEPTL